MEIAFLVLIGIIVGAGAGFYSGYKYARTTIINELTDMVLENVVDLNHEVVGEEHYLYYKETGEFAAQGTTLDHAAEKFTLRDSSIGRIKTSLGTTVFIVDGKIETE